MAQQSGWCKNVVSGMLSSPLVVAEVWFLDLSWDVMKALTCGAEVGGRVFFLIGTKALKGFTTLVLWTNSLWLCFRETRAWTWTLLSSWRCMPCQPLQKTFNHFAPLVFQYTTRITAPFPLCLIVLSLDSSFWHWSPLEAMPQQLDHQGHLSLGHLMQTRFIEITNVMSNHCINATPGSASFHRALRKEPSDNDRGGSSCHCDQFFHSESILSVHVTWGTSIAWV